jgi:hypothetical protein
MGKYEWGFHLTSMEDMRQFIDVVKAHNALPKEERGEVLDIYDAVIYGGRHYMSFGSFGGHKVTSRYFDEHVPRHVHIYWPFGKPEGWRDGDYVVPVPDSVFHDQDEKVMTQSRLALQRSLGMPDKVDPASFPAREPYDPERYPHPPVNKRDIMDRLARAFGVYQPVKDVSMSGFRVDLHLSGCNLGIVCNDGSRTEEDMNLGIGKSLEGLLLRFDPRCENFNMEDLISQIMSYALERTMEEMVKMHATMLKLRSLGLMSASSSQSPVPSAVKA